MRTTDLKRHKEKVLVHGIERDPSNSMRGFRELGGLNEHRTHKRAKVRAEERRLQPGNSLYRGRRSSATEECAGQAGSTRVQKRREGPEIRTVSHEHSRKPRSFE
jgi:hypothetical protein